MPERVNVETKTAGRTWKPRRIGFDVGPSCAPGRRGNRLHPRDATTTTDLNVVTSEASAANSLHPRDATTTTDLNVVTSEASAANSLYSGRSNAEPQPQAEARDKYKHT